MREGQPSQHPVPSSGLSQGAEACGVAALGVHQNSNAMASSSSYTQCTRPPIRAMLFNGPGKAWRSINPSSAPKARPSGPFTHSASDVRHHHPEARLAGHGLGFSLHLLLAAFFANPIDPSEPSGGAAHEASLPMPANITEVTGPRVSPPCRPAPRQPTWRRARTSANDVRHHHRAVRPTCMPAKAISAGAWSLQCPRAPGFSVRRLVRARPPIPVIITKGPAPLGCARFHNRSDSLLALVNNAPKQRNGSNHWA